MIFTEAKAEFDKNYGNSNEYNCFLSVHTTRNTKTELKNKHGKNNEQYYKWQFLYSVVNSGLFSVDYIGTEIHFPKGNKSSASLILDAAIFDDKSWFEKYTDFQENNTSDSLDWLHKHLLVAIEIKKEDGKNIQEV